MTYPEALKRAQSARETADECKHDYLAAKAWQGMDAVGLVFSAAVVAIEAQLLSDSAEQNLEDIVVEENYKQILAERSMSIEQILENAG